MSGALRVGASLHRIDHRPHGPASGSAHRGRRQVVPQGICDRGECDSNPEPVHEGRSLGEPGPDVVTDVVGIVFGWPRFARSCLPYPVCCLFERRQRCIGHEVSAAHVHAFIGRSCDAGRHERGELSLRSLPPSQLIDLGGVESRPAAVRVERPVQQSPAHVGIERLALDSEACSCLLGRQPIIHALDSLSVCDAQCGAPQR